jgi:hypothetical protein
MIPGFNKQELASSLRYIIQEKESGGFVIYDRGTDTSKYPKYEPKQYRGSVACFVCEFTFDQLVMASSLRAKLEATSKTVFTVSHEYFCTDHIENTLAFVAATTKQEALDLYNALAQTRLKYPYFWSIATIKDVEKAEIIRGK